MIVLSLSALALFLSAFLLFWVQPLFAKMVLPLLGGAPAVWNTAMVFFQLMLLGGYVYAHLLARRVPGRAQMVVHGAVLAVGLAQLYMPDMAAMARGAGASHWVAIARDAAALAPVAARGPWQELRAQAGRRAWTDDFSDLLGALVRN